VHALLGLALAGAVAAPAPASAVIGRSVEGRPITLERLGDPAAPRKVLLVGSVHGDERAGRRLLALLAANAVPPAGSQLLLVRDLNPDGAARRTRANARGVDLNRNSSAGWAGAGRRPWSEPETRTLRDLVLRERPAVTIFLHQPLGVVDVPSAGSARLSRRYARLARLPVRRLPTYPGSLTRWENARVLAGSAFVVELPRGPMTNVAVLRHAAAVFALARSAST
jgi:murein peptide amidase A